MKSKSTMLLLWIFTGLFGGHRFYVGKTFSGLIYMFTGGLFLVGWGLDFFRLGSMVDDYNLRYRLMNGGSNTNQNTNQNNIVINMAAPTAPVASPAAAQPQTQQ